MKKLVTYSLFAILFLSYNTYGQRRTADSLIHLIRKDNIDTNKVNHLNALAIELWSDLDTAIICSYNALQISKALTLENGEHGWKKGIGKSLYLMGVFNFDKGNFVEALTNNEEALKIWDELEKNASGADVNQIKFAKAKSTGEIGNAYFGQGNYPKALEFQLKALKLNEELKNEKGIGNILGNIGNIYSDQMNFKKALEYYSKSLKVSQKLNNKYDVSIDLRNIGLVYKNMNNNEKSLEYFLMALAVSKELGNELEIANNLCSVGSTVQNQADAERAKGKTFEELKDQYAKAFDYYEQSLELDERLGNTYGVSMNLSNMGSIYFLQKNYDAAEKLLLKALAIDSANGAMRMIKFNHEYLSDLYTAKGEYKKALDHFRMYSAAKDSLFNEERDKEITRHEMNYEFEKKESERKAEQEKKDLLAEENKKRQQILFILVSAVAIAIAIIAIIVFRSLRITKKQKLIIEQQKEIVEVKQQEILDSIQYAKRIQQSLLPTDIYIERMLNKK